MFQKPGMAEWKAGLSYGPFKEEKEIVKWNVDNIAELNSTGRSATLN